MKNALSIVNKFFPEVTSITDANKTIQIEVVLADNKNAKVRNHQACAMAIACKRAMKADGVIVAMTKCLRHHRQKGDSLCSAGKCQPRGCQLRP